MRRVAQWSMFAILFLLSTQPHGQAQPAVCGNEYVCLEESRAAAILAPNEPLVTAKSASFADFVRCPRASVDVTAASEDERRLVCSVASDAIELLGRCGISQRRPLRLQVMSEVRHPFRREPIFGFFDAKRDLAFITQEADIASLIKGTPYADLPPRDVYKSFVVHEVTHGIMHQNLKRQLTSHAAYEYPAYALQVASLPSSVRDQFLQSLPKRDMPDGFVFSDILLFSHPFFFAGTAYEHFEASPDGCAYLTALLEGEVAFIVALPQ